MEEQPKMVVQEELDFLEKNYESLKEKYWGKWICIVGSELVAVADTPEEALAQARKQGYRRPVITAINESWDIPYPSIWS